MAIRIETNRAFVQSQNHDGQPWMEIPNFSEIECPKISAGRSNTDVTNTTAATISAGFHLRMRGTNRRPIMASSTSTDTAKPEKYRTWFARAYSIAWINLSGGSV